MKAFESISYEETVAIVEAYWGQHEKLTPGILDEIYRYAARLRISKGELDMAIKRYRLHGEKYRGEPLIPTLYRLQKYLDQLVQPEARPVDCRFGGVAIRSTEAHALILLAYGRGRWDAVSCLVWHEAKPAQVELVERVVEAMNRQWEAARARREQVIWCVDHETIDRYCGRYTGWINPEYTSKVVMPRDFQLRGAV